MRHQTVVSLSLSNMISLFSSRLFKVLVTHHVELVLPGAHYLVRMLDGRIDVQGTVKDLRAHGVLDNIVQDYESESKDKSEDLENKPESKVEEEQAPNDTATTEKKKPRKLVKEEERETGSVKWSIYKTYLKAS